MMKNLLHICLLFPVLVHSQQFAAIDEFSLNTPNSRTRSLSKLAQHLSEGAVTELEKLRAIYAWETLNIQYEDHYSFSDFWATPEYIEEQNAENVLHNRSAVCQGYANLFCALARAFNLPCEVVTGIVKDPDGSIPALGHAWVAAKADGAWYLFDPTWGVPQPGSGAYTVNNTYFAPPPERFILNHLPDDPAWQLLERPVSERMFRESSNSEIKTYIAEMPDEKFSYKDTLEQWLAMDAVYRMLHMEHRVLQFNGSNERALFSLGQNYWALFYDQHRLLDSLSDASILSDSIQLDTTWFLEQTALLEKYHNRARDLFSRLETRERKAQREKFYTPDDVAAMIFKLKGSLWTGQFERGYHRGADLPRTTQLARLRLLIAQADTAYETAKQTLDCHKMYNSCLEIWHNQSLAYIQMAQREVYLLEKMLNEKETGNIANTLATIGPEARYFFQKASETVHLMTLRPPVFALTREREVSIQQGQLTLRSCEIRARRAMVMPELETLIGSQPFSIRKAEALTQKLLAVQDNLYQFIDSVENISAGLDKGFMQNLLFNLNYETFALQYNLGTLQYRNAWFQWQQARQSKVVLREKENIRTIVHTVFEAARAANSALDAVGHAGQLSNAHLEQRRQQLYKLKEAAQQLLDALQ